MLERLTKLLSKRGFTVAKVMILFFVLAALAAALIPLLTVHIERAKERKYMFTAREVMESAQIEFSELFAENVSLVPESGTIPGIKGSVVNLKEDGAFNNNDVYLVGTEFVKEVFDTAGIKSDEEPYALIFGLGSSDTDYNADTQKSYKIYFTLYWQDEADTESVIYYNGTKWTGSYPWMSSSHPKNYYLAEDAEEPLKLQMYIFTFAGYKSDELSDGWYHLKSVLDAE